MRKALVLILLILTAFFLSASAFRSNELGQKLEKLNQISNQGYVLVEEGDNSVLLLDGEMVFEQQKVVVSESEYSIVRTYPVSGMTYSSSYKDGRLVLETITDRSGVVSYTSYSYNDGHLVLSTTNKDDKSNVRSYLRASDSNQIVGVSEDGNLRFFSDGYLVQNGSVIESISKDLVISGTHTVLDDGTIVVQENGASLFYSPDGRLIETVSGDAVSQYFYTGNTLTSISRTVGNRIEVENYKDGMAYEILVYVNGDLESRTEYRDEGNISFLYSNGRQIAVVYYMKDNRTVEKIEYN